MTIGFRVSIETKAAQKFIRRFSKEFDDKKYLELVGQDGLAWINRNFRVEGIEQKWKPLAASTIRRRRKGRGVGSPRILRDTGRMAQSFVVKTSGSGTWVSVGTGDKKAPHHEFGTSRIPRRRILPTKKEAEKIALDTLTKFARILIRGGD